MPYKVCDFDELILRDLLAIDRTRLANERTFLSYLRTAIMMAVSGITFLKLLPEFPVLRYIGYALLPLSLVVFLIGAFQFFKYRGRITLETTQLEQLKENPSEEKAAD